MQTFLSATSHGICHKGCMKQGVCCFTSMHIFCWSSYGRIAASNYIILWLGERLMHTSMADSLEKFTKSNWYNANVKQKHVCHKIKICIIEWSIRKYSQEIDKLSPNNNNNMLLSHKQLVINNNCHFVHVSFEVTMAIYKGQPIYWDSIVGLTAALNMSAPEMATMHS